MSDSTIEIPTGERSLQTRNRLLVGVCLLLLLAGFFLAASLWLRVNEARKLAVQQKRTMGRLLVDQVMLIEHWEGLENNRSFLTLVNDLSKELGNQEYRWVFLQAEGSEEKHYAVPQDDFERKVLDRFSKAEAPRDNTIEFDDRSLPEQNVYHYYQPIRAKASCLLVCHNLPPGGSGIDPGGTAKAPGDSESSSAVAPSEGDVMGVVKITFPDVPAP